MAVNIQDEGGLSFDASVDMGNFEDGIQLIISGLEKTAKAATEAAKSQNDAFDATADGLSDAARKAQEMQKAFDGFTDAQTKIRELNAEIARMKAPDFVNTDQSKALESRGQTLAYLNQQEKLLNDLKEVAESYKKQLIDLSGIQVKAPQVEVPQVTNVSEIISTQVLEELKKSFGEIDAPTQKFIQDLIGLEIKLQNLQKAEQDLTTAFSEGKITEKDFTDTQSFLIAGIKAVNDQTVQLTDKQKEYEASLTRSNGSIDEKRAALTNLKNAYTALSEAQRNSPEGVDMAKSIASLSAEIKGLQPGKLVETKTNVASIRTELLQLTEQMARNPDSPLFDEWKKKASELKESLKEVKTGIEQATNKTAGIDAFASGLRGLVGGFTAATGVIGLFTDNTEEVDKVTKNAASALALLNGIQEVSNVLSKTSALNVYLLGLMHKSNAAATAIETVATEANTVAAGVNTVAVETQTAATEGAVVAQKSLALAMLSNPAGLLIAGIAAIAGAYLLLRNNADGASASQKAFNDTLKDFAKGIASAEEKVNDVKNAFNLLEGGLISQKDALKKYNDTLGDAMGKTDDLGEAEKRLNDKADVYIQIMGLKEQANAMFALSAQKAAQQVENSNKDVLTSWEKFKAGFTDGNFFKADADFSKANKRKQDEQNAALQKEQDALDRRAKYNMALAGQLAKNAGINANLAEVDNDKVTNSRNRGNKAQSEYNKLLNDQKSLLQTIEDLHRGAEQSGLTREATEIDKINEKYDKAIKNVKEYNANVEKFNAKHPDKKQGLQSVDQLEADRNTEVVNAAFRKEADNYKKSLDVQQKYFEDYEKAKVDIGEAKADELYGAQLKGSKNYIDFLKKQKEEIEKSIPDGSKANVMQAIELQAINKKIAEATDQAAKDSLNKQLDDYKTLLKAVVSFNEAKLAINKKYDDLEKTAKGDKTATEQETRDRLAIIEAGRQKENKELENNAKYQSDIYKKLGEDMTFFMADELKKRATELQKALLDPNLSPATKAAIKSMIDRINQLIHDTDPVSIKTLDAADKFSAIAGGLNDISSSLSGIDDNLSKMIGTIGKLSGAVSSSLRNLDLLKNSSKPSDKINAGFGIFGAFFGVVGAINGMINSAARRRAELKAQEDAQMLAIQQGEISINDEYRKRLLLQAQINKSKLEGLKAEQDALKSNAESLKKDFDDILKLIQTQGKAIPPGFDLDAIKVLQTFSPDSQYLKEFNAASSLAGKSFDDLQKLFLTGQLDEKAKALFQTLQDLNAQIADNAKDTADSIQKSNEQLTGTTSSSISDSIIQGFADGKRSAADFANDFQSLMQKSILNSLGEKGLKKQLDALYDQFAKDAESDGILTTSEIAQLRASYNATIEASRKQFDQLQQISGINFNSSDASANSVSGAIRGITQQQGDLLAGQFGGMRLSLIDQLNIAKSNLNILNQIANNTAFLINIDATLRKFDINGIKVK